MQEIWKDTRGLEQYAQVSNLGNIRTKSRFVNNNGTQTLFKGRVKKGSDNGLGYLQYRFTINGTTIRKYGHVMVLETFSEKPSEEHEVDHIDGNKSNNNLENLQWLTRKENMNKMHVETGNAISVKVEKIENAQIVDNKLKFKCIESDCNNLVIKMNNRCVDCSKLHSRKVIRPSKEELSLMLKMYTFTELGRLHGVSDNSVRKWCKSYNLPHRKKDIEKTQ